MVNPAIEVIAVAACSGLASGVGVLIWTAVRPPRRCGECGAGLPRFRKRPANRRQWLWGGWTCPRCASEVDRLGRVVPAGA